MEAPLLLNEAQRLATLHNLHILDTPPEERFDRIAKLAAQLFNVPIALVSLVDANRQWFKACWGLPIRETERSISFCAHTILQDEMLIVPDALLDPRFSNNPLVTREPHIRFYAGQPLTYRDGSKLGTLCIIDYQPRQFSSSDVAILKDLAAWVQSELNLIELAKALEARKKAEEALRRSEEALRQAQKMEAIGRLAGGIAHDFNNILTGILVYTDLISTALPEADPVQQDIEEIKIGAERAAALTRQLLVLSHRQVLQPTLLNLNSVVERMNRLLKRLVPENIELVSWTDPDVANVKADPGQLEQVILNLVVNARDAMPTGGRITIKTQNIKLTQGYSTRHAHLQPGLYVLLEITDTGSGMGNEVTSHLFEPFFTTKEPGKGTGLGLSTVYGIVKQSGGYITVESQVGAGTSFKIYLPQFETIADSRVRAE